MTVPRHGAHRRWSLVAAAAALLCVLPAIVDALPARAAPVAAEELRARIAGSVTQPYEGYAESTAELALPELERLGDVTALLTGTTRIRSWYAAPDRSRVSVIDSGGERAHYRTPAGQVVWDYGANQRTEIVGEPALRLPRGGDLLPPDLARLLLTQAAGDPVAALPPRRVAGIDAVGLRLTPADPETTVGRVDVWAEPGSGLPLAVEITGRGGDRPLLRNRFLEVDLRLPDPASLTPPTAPDAGSGAVLAGDAATALDTLAAEPLPQRLAGRERMALPPGFQGVGRYGTGLSIFVVLPIPRGSERAAPEGARRAGGTAVRLDGSQGVLLATPLLTVLVAGVPAARRTYLLAGVVSPAVLERAAAELAARPRSRR